MKTPNTLYSRLALITSVMLITGYLIVSAVWVPMDKVGPGNQLTADLWNTFVDNLNDLDTRLKSTASTWPTVTGGIAYTGGNVGIGTVNPGYPLDITGLVNTQGTLGGFRAAPRDGIGTSFSWYNPTGDDFRMYASAIGDLLTVQANGNIGIGTTDPGGYRTAIRGLTDDNTASALWVSGASSLTGALVVRNDGNVGIGTATPGARLEVTGAANAYTAIFQSSLTASQAYGPMIHAGTNSTDFAFTVNDATNTNPLFRVRGDGNVGIGTATPLRLLSLKGSVPVLRFEDTDAGGAVGEINVNNAFGSIIIDSDASNTTAGSFTSFQVDSAEKMRIDSIGNVGIGTASPGYKLEVNGSVYSSSYLAADAHRDSRLQWLIGYAGSNEQRVGSALGTDFTTLWSGGNERIRILSDGRVGIGTTNPYAKIHSMGQTFMMGSTTDLVWGSVGTIFQGEFGAASGNTYTKLESFIGGGSAYGNLAINPGGGNVGIGAIPTGTKLKVTQIVDNQWTSHIEGASPTAGQNYGLTVRAGTNSSDISFNIMDKTSTNYYLHVRGDGNVGIGTGSPAYKLTVNGQPAANGYTAFTNYSDKRLKENISGIGENMLDKIMKLRPVEYNYNDKYFGITGYDKATKDKTYKGFIAQELQKVFPEMVGERPFGNEKYLDTDLSNLQIYMVKAMQELKQENDELKKRIEKLEKR